jgi:hypothetical protein
VRTNPQTEAALAKYAYLQALGVCRSPGRRAGLEVDTPLLHPPTQPDRTGPVTACNVKGRDTRLGYPGPVGAWCYGYTAWPVFCALSARAKAS